MAGARCHRGPVVNGTPDLVSTGASGENLSRGPTAEVSALFLEELRRRLRRRPFRVHLADGRAFDVRYPNLQYVGETAFALGLPEANSADPFLDYTVLIPLGDICRLEQEADPAPGEGA